MRSGEFPEEISIDKIHQMLDEAYPEYSILEIEKLIGKLNKNTGRKFEVNLGRIYMDDEPTQLLTITLEKFWDRHIVLNHDRKKTLDLVANFVYKKLGIRKTWRQWITNLFRTMRMG